MYKLLLVTNCQKVSEAFSAITSWPYLGFKEPRRAGDIETAFDIMSRHHVDGVVMALDDVSQGIFIELMNEKPLLPILQARDVTDTSEAVASLEKLRSLLNRTHADYSNDRYSESDMMQLCRHEYFRKLLGGAETAEQEMLKNLLLLRSRMNPYAPCVIMELIMPDDEGYLQGKWMYGADRLEVAMRNIFGAEKNGMRILVSVVDEKRIFLTGCPMIGEEAPEGREKLLSLVQEHADAGIAHVREFLGIELRIAWVQVRDSLLTLAHQGL